jgi:hypothetical protein
MKNLSKFEIIIIAIGLPILIVITQGWHESHGMAIIFLAGAAAVISFAVAVFRWWLGPTPSGRSPSRIVRR